MDDQAVLDLNQKIDALTTQVAYLAEQARRAERARAEQAELFESLMPIAKDAMRLASDQFEEVEEYVDLADLLRLLKKLVRRLPLLESLLDQIDTVTDLVDTIGPIPRQAMDKVVEISADLERKGYFDAARGGMSLADAVVTSFGAEDFKKPVNPSLWAIMGQLNDPDVRRSLALTLRILKVVGQQAK